MALSPVNRKAFFDAYRERFGRLSPSQVAGLESLLSEFEADPLLSDRRQIAYALATAKHETADTFQPIEEYGKGKGRKYGKAVERTNAEGETVSVAYYGRGYVQLTWERNYELFGSRLGLDLVGNPALAMTPSVAYRILSDGMRLGLFTGKKLSDYINARKVDYVGARRIINGTDRAEHIAAIARDFEEILTEAAEPDETVARPAAPDGVAEATPVGAEAATAGGAAGAADTSTTTNTTNVVGEAQTVVNTAPPTAQPVAGGALDDPAKLANKTGLGSKIAAWATGTFGITFVADKITTLTGLSPNAQLAIVVILGVLGVLAVVIVAVDHFQTKYIRARPDLQNTK